MIIKHALQHSSISPLLVPHLVSIVLKSKVKMCPQVGLVVVREEGPFFKVSYEPSDREVICVCIVDNGSIPGYFRTSCFCYKQVPH